ncbi:MAG: hypothetical protein M0O94_00050 [Bacteroidales bacterium]|nr:hypothetical protein [Bacteroidales bacterium]HPE85814.1 hypothetical protein [Bacteroidales bacterium]
MNSFYSGCVTIISALVLLLAVQCDSPADIQPPEIAVIQPEPGDSFNVYDTLLFSFHALTDYTLLQVNAVLVDDEGQSVIRLNVPLEGSSVSLDEIPMILSRKDLPTGMYDLEFTVTDTYGTAAVVVPVMIYALDLHTKNRYLISHTSHNQTDIHILQEDLTLTYAYSVQGDFGHAATDSQNNLLYTVGRYSGHLMCYSVEDKAIQWMVEAVVNPPFPFFSAAVLASGWFWVALYQDNVFAYDHAGIEKFRTYLIHERYPEALYVTDRYLVAVERTKYQQKVVLTTWYANGGAFHDAVEMPYDSLLIIGHDHDVLYLSGYTQGQTTLFSRDILYNENLPLGTYNKHFTSVCRGFPGTYFLVCREGVVRFSPPYTLVQVLSRPHIRSITFDHAENVLWLIAANQIEKYNAHTFLLENSNTFDAIPDAILIMYNRNVFNIEKEQE